MPTIYDLNSEQQDVRARLLGSPILFTQFFFKERTGREFVISRPIGRPSHHLEIFKELTSLCRNSGLSDAVTRLMINTPPRYSKTITVTHLVAWALAKWPDCNFLYLSYAHTLATKSTQEIRDILELATYKALFPDTRIDPSSSAKDNFLTTAGGSVYAAGFGGSITGRGAGIKNCERFGGAVIIDDAHKPGEAESDTIRDRVIDTFNNTIQSRLNDGDRTPMIYIGQRVHERDLPASLLEQNWKQVIFPALDAAGNALDPRMHTKEQLLKMKDEMPYVFASQYQQNPIPPGGSLYKVDWFPLLDEEPRILATFLTCDTAETDKTYNDKTVFSFWGIYKIVQKEIETDEIGLHWINCAELNVEPKDLEPEFWKFYNQCKLYPIKPQFVAIEKKSTGVTLLSILKNVVGLRVVDIERSSASGSKTSRLIQAQAYVSRRVITLPRLGRHTQMCLDHLSKITANNSHRFDDIADTMADATRLVYVDDYFKNIFEKTTGKDEIYDALLDTSRKYRANKNELGRGFLSN